METIIPRKIKEIFDKLQDEESRLIFTQRLMYFLDGDLKHFRDIIFPLDKRTENYERSFLRLKNSYNENTEKIVLFGAGSDSGLMPLILMFYGLKADCYCDSDPAKQNTTINGLSIISPDKLLKDYRDAYIIISSSCFENEIRSFILSCGIQKEKILFPAIFHGNQYFVTELALVENEFFVDVGCYNGGTIYNFLQYCKRKYKKIYGFEPDPHNCAVALEKIKNEKNIIIYNKGVWNEDTELVFDARNSAASRVSPDGHTTVSVTSINNIVSDEPITFIKMDVEGSELEALLGARNTILINEPKFAICVYHKPEDILTIPLYIQGFIPEYKFYVRHHSLSQLETVLYDVI